MRGRAVKTKRVRTETIRLKSRDLSLPQLSFSATLFHEEIIVFRPIALPLRGEGNVSDSGKESLVRQGQHRGKEHSDRLEQKAHRGKPYSPELAKKPDFSTTVYSPESHFLAPLRRIDGSGSKNIHHQRCSVIGGGRVVRLRCLLRLL